MISLVQIPVVFVALAMIALTIRSYSRQKISATQFSLWLLVWIILLILGLNYEILTQPILTFTDFLPVTALSLFGFTFLLALVFRLVNSIGTLNERLTSVSSIVASSDSTLSHDALNSVAIIPAYNEEKTIAKVVSEAATRVDKVIVVDDGSQDSTADLATQSGAVVVSHPINLGVGWALNTGLRVAKKLDPAFVVILDADGQHDPSDIPKLIGVAESGIADIVIGARVLERSKMPLYKRFGNMILNKASNRLLGLKLNDYTSGFRVFNRVALHKLPILTRGYDWTIEMIVKSRWKELRISEVPIATVYGTRLRRGADFYDGVGMAYKIFRLWVWKK